MTSSPSRKQQNSVTSAEQMGHGTSLGKYPCFARREASVAPWTSSSLSEQAGSPGQVIPHVELWLEGAIVHSLGASASTTTANECPATKRGALPRLPVRVEVPHPQAHSLTTTGLACPGIHLRGRPLPAACGTSWPQLQLHNAGVLSFFTCSSPSSYSQPVSGSLCGTPCSSSSPSCFLRSWPNSGLHS